MSDLNSSVVAAAVSLLPRAARSRDNFDAFAFKFPAALYARRGVSELVDNLDHLADRIEAGAAALPGHIGLSIQDLLRSVVDVCNELDAADETVDFAELGIVRIDFHKRALAIALDIVNLSVRVDAIHAGINHDFRAVDIDATYVLQNVAKLQASISAIHEQRTFPHSTRETTLRVQSFLEIAAACVQSQRDEIKSKSTGTGIINKYYNTLPATMQAKYICDVPAVSEEATMTIAPSPEGKGSCVTVVDQAKGNKRILRFDENHKQGLDLKVPPHWFGGWTRCSPDGTLVLRCDDETFSVFSLTKRLRLGGGDCGCMIHIKHRHRHKLWKGDSVFSPDSKKIGLAFSSAVDSTRAHDRFWKVRVLGVSHDRTKLEEVGNVKGHLLLPGQQMARLAFSPDGSRLATVSWKVQAENKKVPGPAAAFAVWDIASGACLNVVQAPLEMTETLCLKPRAIRILEWNGRWVLSAWLGRTGRLVIWDINAAKIILDRNLHFLPGLAKDNAQVGVAARGTDIIIGRAVMGSIQVWNAMRGQMLCVAQDADRMHHQPFLSPDGRYLVGRSEGKGNNTKTGMTSTCRVWQLLV